MRSLRLKSFVQLLLTLEAGGSLNHDQLIKSSESISQKLSEHLSKRIGRVGYETLLERAVALSAADFPHLEFKNLTSPGVAGEDSIAAATALHSRILELLTTFIGDDLTFRILQTIWPELAKQQSTAPWEKE
jgi:hypothetical protein